MEKLLVIVLLFFFSCQPNNTSPKDKTLKYFFAGHTYQWGAPHWGRMDYRLEKVNFKEYDELWFGGDLVENLPHHPNNIQYLDSLIDLDNENTLWALGNHDVLDLKADFSFIENKTKRKSYYSKIKNGICVMVLNTTEFGFHKYYHKPHECETLDGQLNMINAVADTLKDVSHLVILHHHALLTNDIAENKFNVMAKFNFYDPTLNIGCKVRGTFEELVYPKLVEVQKRGIQVVLVGGDCGQQIKEFEFTSKEGVTFLGSGLNNSYNNKPNAPEYFSFDPDQVLIFSHQPEERKLTWDFVKLDSLIQ